MASGLAGKVRRSTESDEFDLANYDQARCDELARAAFVEPFALQEMVRLSFIVGGGKLVRQKYSDDLPKMLMSALSAIGLVDDSAAACEVGSAGKFKFQHDTGKNLKFVHVFPRIGAPTQSAVQEGEDGEEEEDAKPVTPETLLFRCDKDEFARLVKEQLPTYGQKKRLLDLLKARVAKLEEIEGKMARLETLLPEEQALFDDVGVEEIREKAKAVSGELQALADAGQLTSAEKASLLEQLEARLAAVDVEVAKAEAEGKAKRVQQLQQQLEAIRKTHAAAKACSPVPLPPLRHGQEIRKLHGKLAELTRIEKGSKGNYSVDELRRMSERPEIEEAIGVLKERSRGWFEAEGVFQERVQACLRAAAAAGGGSAGGGAGPKKAPAPAPRPSGGSGFTSVSGGARPAKAKAAAPSTRNAFSALDR